MKTDRIFSDPDAYVAGQTGWRRDMVIGLRAAVKNGGALEEIVKWRNLAYFSNGPVAMIRAEHDRVLLGFWRGQQLRDIETRLKPGGKYQMASLALTEGDMIAAETVEKLIATAIILNAEEGDPTR